MIIFLMLTIADLSELDFLVVLLKKTMSNSIWDTFMNLKDHLPKLIKLISILNYFSGFSILSYIFSI